MKEKVIVLILGVMSFFATGQINKGWVVGKIADENGQAIEFVNISIDGVNSGIYSQKDGSYKIEVPSGEDVVLVFSHLSYNLLKRTIRVKVNDKKQMNIELIQSVKSIQEVQILERNTEGENLMRIDPKVMKLLPNPNSSIESILKTLPGVSSNNELSSSYSVRGGNYDENLVYVVLRFIVRC